MARQPMPVRVLVVDDDAMVSELLAVMLEAEGYAVHCADSGDSALAHLRRSAAPPEIILADVQMPGIAGAQLARNLRRACGSAILLAMSGSGPPKSEISLYDGFLLKPFTTRQFATAVSQRSPRSHSLKPPSRTPRRPPPPPISTTLFSISASASEEASNQTMESPQPEAHPAHSAGNGDAPALNEKIYRQLAGSMPLPQLREMYAMCLNDARERIAAMRTLVRTGDSTRFSREAHSIKGGSGMLGATEIYTLAAKLESSPLESREDDPPATVNSLDELSTACDRLERILASRA
jgi:CheY-like chemotaxis protein